MNADGVENPETAGSNALDPILRTAWERFIQYDTAAFRLKNNHIRLRAFVLLLSFVASLLAVAMGFILPASVRTFDHIYPFIYLLVPLGLLGVMRWGYRGLTSKVSTYQGDRARYVSAVTQIWLYRIWIALLIVLELVLVIWTLDAVSQLGLIAVVEGFRLILFALPLLSAGIMAYTTRFVPSQLWVQYRFTTELIRREIYLYRLKAGAYLPLAQEADRKRHLLGQLTQIEQGKTESDPNAQPARLLPVTIFEPPQSYLTDPEALVKQIKAAKRDDDDGFQALTADQYVKFRVEPMYKWYTARSYNEYDAMRRWQVVALIIGGAGSLLAYLGYEAWIAVTTSAAVTVSALANLKLYGRTYLLYHKAAADLRNRSTIWNTDRSTAAQPTAEQAAQLIHDFEDIFLKEVSLWRQQAQDAVAQSDATIYDSLRSGAGSAYIPTDWLQPPAAEAAEQNGQAQGAKPATNGDGKPARNKAGRQSQAEKPEGT